MFFTELFSHASSSRFPLFFRNSYGVFPLHHSVDPGEVAAQQVFVEAILVEIAENEPLEGSHGSEFFRFFFELLEMIFLCTVR